ncbi:MAG: phospholipase [Candidatus Microsaccharimonas sp.]
MKGTARKIFAAVLTAALMLMGLILGATSAAADEPIYPVMNTSEYPPDGIYFRSAPDWNKPIRVTGVGIYSGERVQLKCWEWGTNVPRTDGGSNTLWYYSLNVSRPSVGGYGNNIGWVNAHFVNDGTGPNQVAPSVIRCGTAPAPAPAPAPDPTQPAFDRVAETDRLLFKSSIGVFLQARNSNYGGFQLNWSTDDCSNPLVGEPQRSRPLGYDFRGPCWRHDFGYRNYKDQNRFNETVRKKIDDNFHTDMYNVCNQYTGWNSWKGVQCRRVADSYYDVVRLCGYDGSPTCAQRVKSLMRIFG